MSTASLKAAAPMGGHIKHFTIYRESGEWHWTLSAANSRKIARSAHGYHDKHDCIRSVRSLSLAAYDASIFNAEDVRALTRALVKGSPRIRSSGYKQEPRHLDSQSSRVTCAFRLSCSTGLLRLF